MTKAVAAASAAKTVAETRVADGSIGVGPCYCSCCCWVVRWRRGWEGVEGMAANGDDKGEGRLRCRVRVMLVASAVAVSWGRRG